MKVRRIVSRVEESSVTYDARSSLRTPQRAASLIASIIADEPQEVFLALALNGKHKPVGWYEVSRGTLTASLVHPREVFGPALRIGNVAAIICAHNHPSGDIEPSAHDRGVHERLTAAGELLGVPVLDSFVIGEGGRFYSLTRS